MPRNRPGPEVTQVHARAALREAARLVEIVDPPIVVVFAEDARPQTLGMASTARVAGGVWLAKPVASARPTELHRKPIFRYGRGAPGVRSGEPDTFRCDSRRTADYRIFYLVPPRRQIRLCHPENEGSRKRLPRPPPTNSSEPSARSAQRAGKTEGASLPLSVAERRLRRRCRVVRVGCMIRSGWGNWVRNGNYRGAKP